MIARFLWRSETVPRRKWSVTYRIGFAPYFRSHECNLVHQTRATLCVWTTSATPGRCCWCYTGWIFMAPWKAIQYRWFSRYVIADVLVDGKQQIAHQLAWVVHQHLFISPLLFVSQEIAWKPLIVWTWPEGRPTPFQRVGHFSFDLFLQKFNVELSSAPLLSFR